MLKNERMRQFSQVQSSICKKQNHIIQIIELSNHTILAQLAIISYITKLLLWTLLTLADVWTVDFERESDNKSSVPANIPWLSQNTFHFICLTDEQHCSSALILFTVQYTTISPRTEQRKSHRDELPQPNIWQQLL